MLKQGKAAKKSRQGADRWSVLLATLPFVIMELGIVWFAHGVAYFRWRMVFSHVLFSVAWVALFVGVSLLLRRRVGQIVYGMIVAAFAVMFLTNGVYFSTMGMFFRFAQVFMATEGGAYFGDALKNANPMVYGCLALAIVGVGVAIRFFPKREKTSWRGLFVVALSFLFLHLLIPPLCLGSAGDELTWDAWRRPRNVYASFNDANKNMKLCGLYEYTLRDFYMTFLKPEEKDDPEEIAYLKGWYEQTEVAKQNEYTGIYEGKNIIFLQMEGLDSWLLNEKDTPTLYQMLSESIVFNDHYSYYNGGGSTFNSEFAVNTGFLTPISYVRNAYTFSDQAFPYSLARMFRERGYRTNAFHMNTGEYYSRAINYKNWGYDNYFGLLDVSTYEDLTYELDRELIENPTFYTELFEGDTPFLHYVITYTPHTPFTTEKGIGSLLAKEQLQGEAVLSEEETARLFVGETDAMVKRMLTALEENGLAENTVIVAFADHYLYTMNDKSVLDRYKETGDNRINRTPFFIWSKGQTPMTVEKTNSQLDILPTILNLFGFSYVPGYYVGKDILDEAYEGYVFFPDYSWYDGEVYVADGRITFGLMLSEEVLAQKNARISEAIRQNDLTLKYNYFQRIME